MEETIYQNNDVTITAKVVDTFESKININGDNLIWISRQEQSNFKKELTELLDKYRI
jgi:hypothetical protein